MTSSEAINDAIEQFSKQYRPSDKYRGAEFDSALHALMRAAYAEAVKPFAYELRTHRDRTIRGLELSAMPPIVVNS